MTTPLANRPKITLKDISIGYVHRYFVQNISIPTITEVDENQYKIFKNNANYKTLQLNWIISGVANDIVTNDGNIIYGTRHQNEITVNWNNRKLPGLNRILTNPLEYFTGVDNKI